MTGQPLHGDLSPFEAQIVDRYVDRWIAEGKPLKDALAEVRAAMGYQPVTVVVPQANGMALAQKPKSVARVDVPASESELRTPFLGALPDNDSYFEDLRPTPVSERLAKMLVEYGLEHYFTTAQLWAIGLGATPDGEDEGIDKFNGGKTRLKKLLEDQGFQLVGERLGDGTKHWKYWLERV